MNENRPGAPKWATQPFEDLITDIEHLGQLLEMSVRGISVIQGMPQMVAAVAEAQGMSDHEETRLELAEAEKRAAFAKREVENGFPVLHGNTAIALWSHLEATIRLFLARWLENDKSSLEIEPIQKMRVKIGEYERLQGEDRYFFILDRLEHEMTAPLKCGINRFESILSLLGLCGEIHEKIQRDIFELNQVRNCLMHRAGRADRRFAEACPWLNLEAGQRIQVSPASVRRYFESVMHYASEIICRVGERYGKDMSHSRKAIAESIPKDHLARQ